MSSDGTANSSAHLDWIWKTPLPPRRRAIRDSHGVPLDTARANGAVLLLRASVWTPASFTSCSMRDGPIQLAARLPTAFA